MHNLSYFFFFLEKRRRYSTRRKFGMIGEVVKLVHDSLLLAIWKANVSIQPHTHIDMILSAWWTSSQSHTPFTADLKAVLGRVAPGTFFSRNKTTSVTWKSSRESRETVVKQLLHCQRDFSGSSRPSNICSLGIQQLRETDVFVFLKK